MPNYAQLFCSVADLIADKPAVGVDEARMMQAIREASSYIQNHPNGGWFIPVTLSRSFTGNGRVNLRVPNLLAVTSLTNDGVSIPSSDYTLKPDDGMWPNGPYTELVIVTSPSVLGAWSTERDGVVITGRWGMYEKSEASGATVQNNPQSDSQTTLIVSSGAAVSPGMALLIEDEQQLVTGWSDPTEDVTAINLEGGLDTDDETLVVDDASLVNVGEIIRLEFEDCKVRNKRLSDNSLELIRGWNGTARLAHADDIGVDVYRTVTVERGVNGTTAASHTQNTAISRYRVPQDILGLAKELATLSVNKAQSGYQGRTGNEDTGVVFYNDHLPRFDIATVLGNYYIPRLT